MIKVSKLSIIIGIGIGMMLTSSFNILNSYFTNTKTPDSTIAYSHNIDYENIDKEDLEEENSGSINIEDVNEGYHEVEIGRGMTTEQIAKYLEDEQVIPDAEEFINTTKSLRMTSRLNFGSKKIPYGSTIEEILHILSQPN